MVATLIFAIAGCGAQIEVLRRSTPNPFFHSRYFVLMPTVFHRDQPMPGARASRLFRTFVSEFAARTQGTYELRIGGPVWSEPTFVIHTEVMELNAMAIVQYNRPQTLTARVTVLVTLSTPEGAPLDQIMLRFVTSVPTPGRLDVALVFPAVGADLAQHVERYLRPRTEHP